MRQRHEGTDVTGAAALAVLRVPRDLMRARSELQAVRCHDEQTVSRHADAHAVEQEVADRDERTLELAAPDAKDGP